MKFNLHEEEGRIHIQMVVNLHKTETKPQSVVLNVLNLLDSGRFTE